MRIGLRIDVDTFRGTRTGVPALCELLADHNITATFFFSVGPDNMGRNLWRLFRPAFLIKMLRSNATSLYGWDILFYGTFWRGPNIGAKLAKEISTASNHEFGLHAWDHYAWQNHINKMSADTVQTGLRNGISSLNRIMGRNPTCSAAPGWKINNLALELKDELGFAFNSDCRGSTVFRPVSEGRTLKTPQIPSTLPTFDEVIGNNGVNVHNYNDFMFSQLKPDSLNVLTIHAEVEGISQRDTFAEFLIRARRNNIAIVPMGNLLEEHGRIPECAVAKKTVPGRDGWIAQQVCP
ncbi:MAG: 4-deoxy-4-formamido-L-arabinose-phosphoundecaprenol deformylase [Lentisphaerae bacterium]|nr:4-deoxy-4-formamido-L-arabinose-phosphoundecaprenol deformylase [Lentisphaerota bacterium]